MCTVPKEKKKLKQWNLPQVLLRQQLSWLHRGVVIIPPAVHGAALRCCCFNFVCEFSLNSLISLKQTDVQNVSDLRVNKVHLTASSLAVSLRKSTKHLSMCVSWNSSSPSLLRSGPPYLLVCLWRDIKDMQRLFMVQSEAFNGCDSIPFLSTRIWMLVIHLDFSLQSVPRTVISFIFLRPVCFDARPRGSKRASTPGLWQLIS